MPKWILSISYTTNADEATRIDSGLKNKFRFEWLNCEDEHGDILSSYMRKPRQRGLVFCTCCKSLLSYSSNGKRALISHCLSKKHIKFWSTVKSNQTLPASYQVWQGATAAAPAAAPAKVSSLFSVVLINLSNSSNPKNAKNRVLVGIKRYYIPVFGLSKIFCIFCLGLLASLMLGDQQPVGAMADDWCTTRVEI